MLNRYFIRPTTVDRIRASWIGDPIERYVSWLGEQNYAARNVFVRVPILLRFGQYAQEAGASSWEELPAHVAPFVEDLAEAPAAGVFGTPAPRCCAGDPQSNPATASADSSGDGTSPHCRIRSRTLFLASLIFSAGNGVCAKRPWFSTGIIFSGFRSTCAGSGGHCYPICRQRLSALSSPRAARPSTSDRCRACAAFSKYSFATSIAWAS